MRASDVVDLCEDDGDSGTAAVALGFERGFGEVMRGDWKKDIER